MNSESLVSISDFSKDEILSLLESASRFEASPNRKLLEGKVVATLFFEAFLMLILPVRLKAKRCMIP